MNDTTFDALADHHRRTLLLDLLESNPQDTRVESATTASQMTDVESQTQIAMHHSHLPKLADYGYIEWDKDAHEVVKGPRFDEIRPLLEFLATTGGR